MQSPLQKLLIIKHSKVAYVADFAVYFLLIGWMTSSLILFPVKMSALSIIVYIILGSFSWSLIEYVLHRWVLHQWPPFCEWHHEHHRQPKALICTATLVSLGAIALTVYLPLYWAASAEVATCFTLGLLMGYLAYAVTHHAIHHWPNSRVAWLNNRRVIHCLHHACPHHSFGVTSTVWDRVLGTRLTPLTPPAVKGLENSARV